MHADYEGDVPDEEAVVVDPCFVAVRGEPNHGRLPPVHWRLPGPRHHVAWRRLLKHLATALDPSRVGQGTGDTVVRRVDGWRVWVVEMRRNKWDGNVDQALLVGWVGYEHMRCDVCVRARACARRRHDSLPPCPLRLLLRACGLRII